MPKTEEDTDLWLRRYHPASTCTPRLVCFPHAGGSATWFHPMSAALAPRVEVLAVQYPGRQDRRLEAPIDDIGVLARRIAEMVAGSADRPLALFGHSMGAVVAFEVTRVLDAAGVPAPVRLFVSGRGAPTRDRDEPARRLDDKGIIDELRKLSGTDTRVLGDEEVIRMILPAARADYRAVDSYCYLSGPPVACPITALTGDNDPKTGLPEVDAWQELTGGDFELRVFSGGHFFLANHQEEIVRLIAERLDALP